MRTMLLGTAGSRIGCNSSNVARPRGPCLSQGVPRRLLQKRVCVERSSAYTCARETVATGTREAVTIITNIADQV